MELIDVVGFLIGEYAGATFLAGFVALKGCSAVVANNFHTEEWGKAGQVIDWLASNNKKAKLTGEPTLDAQIAAKVRESKPVKALNKILNVFS